MLSLIVFQLTLCSVLSTYHGNHHVFHPPIRPHHSSHTNSWKLNWFYQLPAHNHELSHWSDTHKHQSTDRHNWVHQHQFQTTPSHWPLTNTQASNFKQDWSRKYNFFPTSSHWPDLSAHTSSVKHDWSNYHLNKPTSSHWPINTQVSTFLQDSPNIHSLSNTDTQIPPADYDWPNKGDNFNNWSDMGDEGFHVDLDHWTVKNMRCENGKEYPWFPPGHPLHNHPPGHQFHRKKVWKEFCKTDLLDAQSNFFTKSTTINDYISTTLIPSSTFMNTNIPLSTTHDALSTTPESDTLTSKIIFDQKESSTTPQFVTLNSMNISSDQKEIGNFTLGSSTKSDVDSFTISTPEYVSLKSENITPEKDGITSATILKNHENIFTSSIKNSSGNLETNILENSIQQKTDNRPLLIIYHDYDKQKNNINKSKSSEKPFISLTEPVFIIDHDNLKHTLNFPVNVLKTISDINERTYISQIDGIYKKDIKNILTFLNDLKEISENSLKNKVKDQDIKFDVGFITPEKTNKQEDDNKKNVENNTKINDLIKIQQKNR